MLASWVADALRVYMISGAPGTDKSVFTIWLASQLALPIFRLCLASPNLTDDRLAQLLSQSSITHNAVVLQVDEFQETLQRWIGSSPDAGSIGVTPAGFCECVQGSTAMGRGVVVLSGTGELVDDRVRRELAAVFPRIHCCAHLSWMSQEDMRLFFRQFLLRFVPGLPGDEWEQWEKSSCRPDVLGVATPGRFRSIC